MYRGPFVTEPPRQALHCSLFQSIPLDYLGNPPVVVSVLVLVKKILCVFECLEDLGVLLAETLFEILSVFKLVKLHHAYDV